MSSKSQPLEVWVKSEPDWDDETSGEELRPPQPVLTGHVHIKIETEIIKEEPECIKNEPEDLSTSNAHEDDDQTESSHQREAVRRGVAGLDTGHEEDEDMGGRSQAPGPSEACVHIKIETEIIKEEPECIKNEPEDSSTSNAHEDDDQTESSHQREAVRSVAGLDTSHEKDEDMGGQSQAPGPEACGTLPETPGMRTRGRQARLKTQENTDSETKSYSCPICERAYARLCHLRRHEQTHTGKKNYTCKICKHKFTLLDNLKRHERTHTGERPYSCDVCKKVFTDASYLKVHKRIHTGEKPFLCKICNKRFLQSSHLKKHEITHTGVKLFECSICGQKCTEKGTLKKHERIHTGERPFACRMCSKKFISCSNLKRHERTHTMKHFIPEEILNRSLCS